MPPVAFVARSPLRFAGKWLTLALLYSVAAIGPVAVSYPLGPEWRLNGIPLPYMGWERLQNDAGWIPFIGCTSLPFLLLDMGIGVYVLHRVMRYFREQRSTNLPPDSRTGQSPT